MLPQSLLLPIALLLSFTPTPISAVKFLLQAGHAPPQKCLWNYAMSDTLVVVSVSAPAPAPVPLPEGVAAPTLTGGAAIQRIDMEIVDGSGSRNVYQSKKGIKGETRMAITTHADAELGVCFRNVLDPSTPLSFLASPPAFVSP